MSAVDAKAAIDLTLFGVVPVPDYDGLREHEHERDGDAWASSAAVLLETKAERPADPLAEMQAMLVEMTKELRERFQRFQSQRIAAEQDAEGAGDEAARKAAQADAKAAIEAVSLIVRTLEKIDGLQRTLIAERAEAERAAGDPDDVAALADEFDRLVEMRVREEIDAEIARRERQRALAEADAAGGAPLGAATGERGCGIRGP